MTKQPAKTPFFLFGGLSKSERKNKPVIREKSHGFIGPASARLAFRQLLFLNSLQQSGFPSCTLDSSEDNSTAVYPPGFCCVFCRRRRGIISTFQFPIAYILKVEILYPITRDCTSFNKKYNLHIIDVSILNT